MALLLTQEFLSLISAAVPGLHLGGTSGGSHAVPEEPQGKLPGSVQ